MKRTIPSDRLEATVVLICDLILDGEAMKMRVAPIDECDLRFELAACLLSSQVSAHSAELAVAQLLDEGLLSDQRWRSADVEFELDVTNSLRGLRGPTGNTFSYRFPVVRARQLTLMREELRKRSLLSRVRSFEDVRSKRAELIQALPGIGPKHASMFLRNVGVTYELAILDAHVINYLQRLGLIRTQGYPTSSLKVYEQTELIAVRYAKSFGRPVGVLDWAIWITMQAAKEIKV